MDNRDYIALNKSLKEQELFFVTRDEYLRALEIIDIYHRQNDKEPKTDHLTEIIKWEYFNTCSIRLKNTLIEIMQGIDIYINSQGNILFKESFIENISIKKMYRIHGVGEKVVKEFIKLRGY